MSGSTRILVIPLKKLILALCVIIAFIIIAVGIRMIMGKKKAFDFDDEKYFEGREDK